LKHAEEKNEQLESKIMQLRVWAESDELAHREFTEELMEQGI
jgi:hypothetical protein